MTPEDIGDIFQELEDNLFALAIRNIKRHENWEEAEGFKWTQWQAEQIAGLREYRKNVQVLTDYHFDKAKDAIKEYLKEAYDESVDDAENTARRILGRFGLNGQMSQNFFGVNSNKLDIIINEAVQNIDTKRYAAINRMNSGYTDFLRRADMFAQSGSYTIPQAVDMASKDFLAAGLNCVEYSNGNRVNIASYTEMALRTSSAEVTRQANGDVRDEFGEYLVVSNVIGMTCPYCQKWQGRVMIDDVYSSGQPDGKHLTVSEAKADHFLHPNCRHQLYMYIPGVTKVADLPNDVETKEHYKAEQKQRYYEREIRKYKRLRDGAVDPADCQKYNARVKEWNQRLNDHLSENEFLRKNPKRLAPGYTGNGKPEVKLGDSITNKPIIPITDQSISRVPKIKVMDDPELSQKIQETNKSILEMSMKDNNNKEVAAVFTLDGKDIGFCKGAETTLTITEDAERVLRMGRPSIVLHNHPRGGRFSSYDISLFLATDNLEGIGYISNAGSVGQVLTKTSTFDPRHATITYNREFKNLKNPNSDSEKTKIVYRIIEKLIKSGDLILWLQ